MMILSLLPFPTITPVPQVSVAPPVVIETKAEPQPFPTIPYYFPDADVNIIYDGIVPIVNAPKPVELLEPLKQLDLQPVAEKPYKPIKFSASVNISTGNTYSYGFCTWYVKNRKPSIPNGWHNAYQWIGYAKSQGWTVSSTPVLGAVGASGNHVVYVESISGGNVTVSEMNFTAWNTVSHRTVPASYFTYIY